MFAMKTVVLVLTSGSSVLKKKVILSGMFLLFDNHTLTRNLINFSLYTKLLHHSKLGELVGEDSCVYLQCDTDKEQGQRLCCPSLVPHLCHTAYIRKNAKLLHFT